MTLITIGFLCAMIGGPILLIIFPTSAQLSGYFMSIQLSFQVNFLYFKTRVYPKRLASFMAWVVIFRITLHCDRCSVIYRTFWTSLLYSNDLRSIVWFLVFHPCSRVKIKLWKLIRQLLEYLTMVNIKSQRSWFWPPLRFLVFTYNKAKLQLNF